MYLYMSVCHHLHVYTDLNEYKTYLQRILLTKFHRKVWTPNGRRRDIKRRKVFLSRIDLLLKVIHLTYGMSKTDVLVLMNTLKPGLFLNMSPDVLK